MPASTLRSSRVIRLLTNVYVDASIPVTPVILARAALLVSPAGSVVARHSAARIWGGIVPDTADVHLLIPVGVRRRLDGVDARESRDLASVMRGGVAVTPPERTFVDLAADLGLVDLVVLGDSLVKRGVVTPQELVDAAHDGQGRGVRIARRAAGLVRAGVDSPQESRLRMLIVLAGLPEPTVNFMIRREDGSWRLRFDLSWPARKVAVEYDGRQHAESGQQWVRDVTRREELDVLGWRLVVVLSPDLFIHPAQTLERIVAALSDRGLRVRVTRREWARYFQDHRSA